MNISILVTFVIIIHLPVHAVHLGLESGDDHKDIIMITIIDNHDNYHCDRLLWNNVTLTFPCWAIYCKSTWRNQYHFHFSKTMQCWKKFLHMIFSYPTSLLPDWSRRYHGNAEWTQNPLMCSVHSLLQDDQRPWKWNAFASAWRKEAPQMQPVRLLNHQCW